MQTYEKIIIGVVTFLCGLLFCVATTRADTHFAVGDRFKSATACSELAINSIVMMAKQDVPAAGRLSSSFYRSGGCVVWPIPRMQTLIGVDDHIDAEGTPVQVLKMQYEDDGSIGYTVLPRAIAHKFKGSA